MIESDNTELEEIYSKTLGAGIKTLAITASDSGDGVSILATALAQRHLLSGKRALFIDFNSDKNDHFSILDNTVSLTNIDESEPQLITNISHSYALLGVPVPTKNKLNLKWRNPGFMEQYLEHLSQEFDAIIIDAGAIHRNDNTLIPPQRIFASAEATLLVVLSTQTSIPKLNYCCEQIKQSKGNLIGCVMNEWHNPNLKQELLRELRRLSKYLPNVISQHFLNWINNNRLLSLDL